MGDSHKHISDLATLNTQLEDLRAQKASDKSECDRLTGVVNELKTQLAGERETERETEREIITLITLITTLRINFLPFY